MSCQQEHNIYTHTEEADIGRADTVGVRQSRLCNPKQDHKACLGVHVYKAARQLTPGSARSLGRTPQGSVSHQPYSVSFPVWCQLHRCTR